eukprot:9293728-Pyramimonas_sp.AAC.1
MGILKSGHAVMKFEDFLVPNNHPVSKHFHRVWAEMPLDLPLQLHVDKVKRTGKQFKWTGGHARYYGPRWNEQTELLAGQVR